jgi:hypothetical protein
MKQFSNMEIILDMARKNTEIPKQKKIPECVAKERHQTRTTANTKYGTWER